MQGRIFAVAVLGLLFFSALGDSASVPLRKIKSISNQRRSSDELAKEDDNVWVADVAVGTPPKNFSLNLDTGSVTMAIYSSSCSKCPYVDPSTQLYSPSSSNTSKIISCSSQLCVGSSCTTGNCTSGATYGDGSSYSGVVYSDTVSIAGVSANNVLFSTADKAGGHFEAPQADGIIGLAYAALGSPASPIDSITGQNSLTNVFYLGFVADGTGMMTVGAPDSSLYTGNFKTLTVYPTFTNQDYGYYRVLPTSVTINGVQVGSSNDWNLVLVDSGATLEYVPSVVLSNMTAQLDKIKPYCWSTLKTYNSCAMTMDQVNQYPNIVWNFSGVEITIYPNEYLLIDLSDGTRFFGLYDSGDDSINLGDPFMIGRYVGFDKTNNQVLVASSSIIPTPINVTSTSTSAAVSTSTSDSTSMSTSTTSGSLRTSLSLGAALISIVFFAL